MKTGYIQALIFGLGFLLFSCSSNNKEGSDQQEDLQEIDFMHFDYIAELHPSMKAEAIVKLLPADKKLIGDKEEGFAYDFTTDKINHSLVVLTYGEASFSDLTIELDFTSRIQDIERSFMYVTKILENRFHTAVTHAASSNQETITWSEKISDENKVLTITLTKYDKLITVNFNVVNNDNEDYGGADGEWVQRGPDGEWIFVPN